MNFISQKKFLPLATADTSIDQRKNIDSPENGLLMSIELHCEHHLRLRVSLSYETMIKWDLRPKLEENGLPVTSGHGRRLLGSEGSPS